jgi:hypothetical protein
MRNIENETVGSLSRNTGQSALLSFPMQLGDWDSIVETSRNPKSQEQDPPLWGADLDARLTNDTA